MYRGKPFAENTIYNFLRLEKYVGIARYDDGVYDNIYPQIVDKEVFDGVQAILAANKIGSRSPESLFLLRNKITCGCCGTHYQGDSGTSKNGTVFYYYKCMGRKRKHICHASVLKKDEFENLILEIIIKVFGTESRINYLADCVMAVYNDKLYDDKIEIYFNFTERKNPDDSDDTDSRDNNYVNCSDILPMCPPSQVNKKDTCAKKPDFIRLFCYRNHEKFRAFFVDAF